MTPEATERRVTAGVWGVASALAISGVTRKRKIGADAAIGVITTASFALVTGCQMAHVTCLAAARHDVLERVGWDVESKGLAGSPPITVVAGDRKHGDFAFNREAKAKWGLKRLFLHSERLEFPHPQDEKRMVVESPLPQELVDVLTAAGLRNASPKPVA